MKRIVCLVFMILGFLTAAASAQEIKVGVVSTGPFVKLLADAARIAADEASKTAGIKIVVIGEDGGCTKELTTSAIKKLRGAGTVLILGSFCGTGISAGAESAKTVEIPVISLGVLPRVVLTSGFPWFISEVQRPERWARGLTRDLEQSGVKEVAVLASDNEYGAAGFAGLEQGKFSLSSHVTFPPQIKDFSGYLTKMKKTDGLALAASPSDAARAITQSVQVGLDPKIMAVLAPPSVEFLEATKGIPKRILFPISYPPDLDTTKQFFSKISTLGGVVQFAQPLYRAKDAIDMFAAAVRKLRERTPPAVRESLRTLAPTSAAAIKGLAGRVYIDTKTNEWFQEFYVGEWTRGAYRTAGGPKNHERGP